MPQRRNATKGARTRRLLLDAARRLLERDGYHALKVTDIAPEAGLSAGVFYVYFDDKQQIALEIFREVTDENETKVYAEAGPSDPFDAVLKHMAIYVRLMLSDGALLKAIMQMLDELPEARAIWHENSARISRRIAKGLHKRSPSAVAGAEARIVYAHAAQSMSDTMLLNIVAYGNKDLEGLGKDPERLTQILSILWYRMLYGKSPPPEKCRKAIDFLPSPVKQIK